MKFRLRSLGLLLVAFADPAFLQAAKGGTLNQSDFSPQLQHSLEQDWTKSNTATPINWSQIIALIIQLMPLILALFGGGAATETLGSSDEFGWYFELPAA